MADRCLDEAAAPYDLVIVGGGIIGCALAKAMREGHRQRRILVIEQHPGRVSQLSGELIHPAGAMRLMSLDLLPAVLEQDAASVEGFAVYQGGGAAELRDDDAIRLYYAEVPGAPVAGYACHHEAMVLGLRERVRALEGVTFLQGKVTGLLREDGRADGRVIGVEIAEGARRREIRARLVCGCDGRRSTVRKLLQIPAQSRHLSFNAGVLVPVAALPFASTGHVFLGAPGPILAYPIASGQARVLLDVPAALPAKGREAIASLVRASYLTAMPPRLRAAVDAALDAHLELVAIHSIATRRCVEAGALIIGDAAGCLHPMTASGMTTGLNDVALMRELSDGLLAEDPRERDAALLELERRRYDYERTRRLLANALYQVFKDPDRGTAAIRDAVFRYWRRSPGGRARTMGLLSGWEPHPSAFLREYLGVIVLAGGSLLRGERRGQLGVRERARTLAWMGRVAARNLGDLSAEAQGPAGLLDEALRLSGLRLSTPGLRRLIHARAASATAE